MAAETETQTGSLISCCATWGVMLTVPASGAARAVGAGGAAGEA